MSSTLLPPHANSFVIGPAVIKHTRNLLSHSPFGLQAPRARLSAMRANRTPVGKRRTAACVALTSLVAASLMVSDQARYKYASSAGSTTTGKFSAPVGVTTCADCGAGKYASSAGSSVCTSCATGTYVNVTGGTTCLECSQDSCPFPVTFELSSCTPKRTRCVKSTCTMSLQLGRLSLHVDRCLSCF